jgi:hypothetical protein
MADGTNHTTTDAATDAGATDGATDQTAEELAREKKRANDAYANLRKRDATITALTQRLDRLESERSDKRETRQAATTAITGDDPEPDADTDYIAWMKWSRREDQRMLARDRQRQEMDNINTFGATSEAIARQQVPDYDKAMEFLRTDYRKELEDSGELDEAAMQLMSDPNQRQNIANHAAAKGLSESDAARDLCAMGAWEWRRQRIVLAQKRLGGNPALKALDLAKRRGWGTSQGNQGTTGVVDDGLKELERKRALRAAGNTTADVRDGGEVREKRAWTYDQLAELSRTNKTEYNKVIKEIAADADSNPAVLDGVIRH